MRAPLAARGARTALAAPSLPADRYLDREQSWVLFNQRVLELAEDDQTPLLERVRFLAIFASNLDEFFMVRVAGLMRRMAAGLPVYIPSGYTPDELLKNTLAKSGELASRHAAVFADLIKPAARAARHRDPPLEGADRAASAPACPSCSGTGSTPSSRPWWWTRRTRSRSSPGCRSTSRSPSPTRPTA